MDDQERERIRRSLNDSDRGINIYYDREGKPIGFGDWAVLHEDNDYKIVRRDYPVPEIRVSTAWLGMDHQYGDGPPVIFETMVFDEEGGRFEELGEWTMRHHTETQAIAYHEKTVADVKQWWKGVPIGNVPDLRKRDDPSG